MTALKMTIAGRKPGFRELFRDTPNEGAGGAGDDDAAAAAAAAAAVKKAEEDAAAAAAAAAASKDDPELKKAAAEKADLLREVMDKKAKLTQAQKDAADARAALAKYNGVDPEKVAALLKKEEDAEKLELERKGEFDTLKARMAAEHERDMAAANATIEELRAKSKSAETIIDNLTVGAAFSNSPYITENLIISPAKARVLYGTHFEVKDGVILAYDKPVGAAGRELMVDAKGEPMAFETAFERIIDADADKKTLMKTKVAPGANSKTVKPDGTQKSQSEKPALYGVSRIAAGLAKQS